MFKLNNQQEQIVNCLNGPVLVLAAAGTGKTRTLVSRFIKLVKDQQVDIHSILCVTFSNKASNEMLERIMKEISVSGLWVGTFHAICYRLLQLFELVSPDTSIIDEEDQKKIAVKLDIVKDLQNIKLHREGMSIFLNSDEVISLKKYESFLLEHNLLDFSGILTYTYNNLESNENFRAMIKQKFNYVMVDEYQDTSSLQNKILMHIINENQNIFCVGDDDQAIYSWRGADIKNILNFQQVFPQANVFRLEYNYRSTIPIINVANSVVEYSINRLPKRMISEEEGEKVVLCCSRNEFGYIAQTIRELPKDKSIAILIRSNSLLNNLEQELLNYAIPYKIFGGMRFFEKLEIKVAISYLKAVFLNDIIALEKALSIPKRGIGPKKINSIISLVNLGYSFVECFQELKLYDLAQLFGKWQALEGSSSEVLHQILIDAGLYDFFEKEEGRMENLELLLQKVGNFPSIKDFLKNFFSLDMDNNDRKQAAIMTIHAAKGLEFDCVFIPCLIEGIFPHIKSIKSGNLEEERRLLYVAMTRAKEKLFMTYNIGQRMFYELFGPSRFLNNLERNYIDFISF